MNNKYEALRNTAKRDLEQDNYTTEEPRVILELLDERDALAKEVRHWKANHATEVERGRLLKERRDMPLERINAYDNYLSLVEQVQAAKENGIIRGGE